MSYKNITCMGTKIPSAPQKSIAHISYCRPMTPESFESIGEMVQEKLHATGKPRWLSGGHIGLQIATKINSAHFLRNLYGVWSPTIDQTSSVRLYVYVSSHVYCITRNIRWYILLRFRGCRRQRVY